ncbi:protein of unknown function [Desulfatibacillum alkenivorans DSM 16219]|uniref:DUF3783 domain-containing protein n=1 Tax=Desulfatibacillum alkenivorans DSM 16219 TaxID=1121393 RepID=A0A1M6VZ60_9BACT|nr:DUF3783 domain-containing protein [Desulfatibacillum alkenivorans]SHK86737.1 protein of unknown function [Desulfatibacillum alkenivorans DSM 16219]
MSDNTMTRVTDSDQPMYGPRTLLVCGYSADAQDAFLNMLKTEVKAPTPVVFCTPEDGDTLLSELVSLPDGRQKGREGKMPPAVIMSGITEKELKLIMNGWKTLGLPRQLWAALTPTSETWTLRALIRELQSEYMAMLKQQQQQQQQQ